MKDLILKPILILPLFVLFSRMAEEYYPISHYPMYATVDTTPVWYIYLGDADKLTDDGFPEPLPMEYVVGIRPAKAKKGFQNDLKKRAGELEMDRGDYYDLPEGEWTYVGEKYLREFRKLAKSDRLKKKHDEKEVTVPDRFALIFAEISIEPGNAPTETRRVIALEEMKGGEVE